MATYLESVVLDELSADRGSPAEGQMWFNTTTDQLKMYEGGVTRIIADGRHTDSVSNPHSVDLEQARTDGNTLAGDINMNNAGAITNLPAPVNPGDAANKQYVDNEITAAQQGLDWQESVLDKDLVTAPVSPTTGDRYIIAGIGGGWSGGTINDIAEWDGTAWVFATPNEGFTTRVEDEDKMYTHDGTSWGPWDAIVDHGGLSGLGDDDHTQYHNDTRGDARYFQKTEHLNVSAGAGDSGKPIKLNASGEVDITMIDNDTAQWNANELQGNPVDATSPNLNDILVWDGDSWAIQAQGVSAESKAGTVAAGSFAGSPKTAAVVFGTAYGDNLYSVNVTSVGTGSTGRVLSVSAKSATGFTIELNTSSTTNLTSVEWHTVPHMNA